MFTTFNINQKSLRKMVTVLRIPLRLNLRVVSIGRYQLLRNNHRQIELIRNSLSDWNDKPSIWDRHNPSSAEWDRLDDDSCRVESNDHNDRQSIQINLIQYNQFSQSTHLAYSFIDLVFDIGGVIFQRRDDAHDLLAFLLQSAGLFLRCLDKSIQ